MKKLAIAFYSCLIVAGHVLVANGEEKSAGLKQRPFGMLMVERQLERMKETLNLSVSQAEKIKPILERNQGKFRELRLNTSLSQEDRRAKLREIIQESAVEMKAVLTSEQQTKWREELLKRREELDKGQKDR